ncbi:hypothetical protein AEA42_16670 [Shewanella sp. Sh95]|nr:hypothetical protein SXM_2901 [Shewanella xiamenensis]KPN75919.1 hypothetical protein AEA42_16670 [Shewanella sp. Sh95]
MQTLLNNASHKHMTALSFIKLHKKEQDFYIFLTNSFIFLSQMNLFLKFHLVKLKSIFINLCDNAVFD